MQIRSLTNTLQFKGTYYLTTDTHSRMPEHVKVLSEIERRKPNNNEPVFLFDCGDFLGDNYNIKSAQEIYSAFANNNPDITSVFGLGNIETEMLIESGFLNNKCEELNKSINSMANSGIAFVSATYHMMLRKNSAENRPKIYYNKNIKPYVVLKDKVKDKDGNLKKQDVFVTSINKVVFPDRTEWKTKEEFETLDYIKELIDSLDKKPDKVVLLLHEMKDCNQKLIEYAKEIGIENLELVVGGHDHTIADYNVGNTRALNPPAMGFGAYEVKSTEDGFQFDRLKINHRMDYSVLNGQKGVIYNEKGLSIPISDYYKQIILNPRNSVFSRVITPNCPLSQMEFRDIEDDLSNTTPFGTFLANEVKNATNDENNGFKKADIGLIRNQNIRAKLPKYNSPVNYYDILDCINTDTQLRQIEADSNLLKQIFEASFKKQKDGYANSYFCEFSNNLVITRSTDDNDCIKQISILNPKTGLFEDLLDKNGKPLDKSRKFVINYINQADVVIKNNTQPKVHDSYCARTILEKALVDYSGSHKPISIEKSKVITV